MAAKKFLDATAANIKRELNELGVQAATEKFVKGFTIKHISAIGMVVNDADVNYVVEKIDLPSAIQAVASTPAFKLKDIKLALDKLKGLGDDAGTEFFDLEYVDTGYHKNYSETLGKIAEVLRSIPDGRALEFTAKVVRYIEKVEVYKNIDKEVEELANSLNSTVDEIFEEYGLK